MSRIGRKTIEIPNGVEVKKDNNTFSVKGPLGSLTREFDPSIEINIADKEINLKPAVENLSTKSLWGTYASHVNNMINGVTKGFERKLLIEGVGYKWSVNGTNLVLDLGFSHDVIMPIPQGLTVVAEKGVLTITGIDKELVGLFAAKVKYKKKVEPYKGKGIRYEGEIVKRKQGKKTVS